MYQNMVLLQFSWRRGSKDSGGQGFKGLFSKDFINAFNLLSIVFWKTIASLAMIP
jgi:hypothetical protein